MTVAVLAGALLAAQGERADALRKLVIDAAEAGKRLTVYVELFGRRMRGKVLAADEEGVEVKVLGQKMKLPWDDLGEKKLLSLARAAAGGEEELKAMIGEEPEAEAEPEPPPVEAGRPPPPEPEEKGPQRAPPARGAVRVQLSVQEKAGVARAGWPVTCGIPFKDGALPAQHVAQRAFRVVDSSGGEIPSQAEVACTWGRYPQGSNGYAKWVHVTFLASVGARGRAGFVFEAGPGVRNSTRQGVSVEKAGGGVTVTTGPLKFAVCAGRMNLLDAVWLDLDGDGSFGEEERIVTPRQQGNMFVEHARGKGSTASDAAFKVEVEEAGPLRAVVKVTSKYDKEFESVVRFYAYAGKSFIRVQDTLVHGPTGQGLHAFKRIGESRLTEHSLFLPLALNEGAKAVFGGAVAVELGEAHLEQDVAHQFKQGGGGFPFELKGAGGTISKGTKAPGWVDVSDGRKGVTACVKYFWQLFPKRLGASREGLKIELWARNARLQPDGANRHYQGMARTHDILLLFHGGGFSRACESLARAHADDLFAACSPEYYCSSRAYARHPLSTARHGRHDANVLQIAGKSGRSGFPAWREDEDAWGYFNFGDAMLGPYWSCLEYDSPWGLLQSFYRLGDVDILREVAILCREAYDMLFHHQYTESTSMYPQCSHDKQENHWRGGDSHGQKKGTDPGHVFISGLVNYWYLTGDRRARDVVFWSFPVYWGDDKERISCGGTWRYCGGYVAEILVRAYELTWEKRYIDRLEWMCDHVFRKTPTRHPDGVWWGGGEGAYSCQPWLADQLVYGYTSYLDVNPRTKYRKDIEEAAVKLADFVDKHAYARGKKAIHQGLKKKSKDSTKYEPTGQYYGGFMCMMSSFTMCKAFELTKNPQYLKVAQELFNDGLAGWGGNKAKSAGEAMMFSAATLYYLKGGR